MNLRHLSGKPSFCLSLREISRVLCAGFLALGVCLSLFAQGNFGRILGRVQDQSGSAVFGASVTVIDVQRGISRPLSTDQAGEYVAPDLFPGSYKIRVEAIGFKTFERTDIVLEVGKDARVDIVLQPGDVRQVVEVHENIPMVDSTSATLGGTLSNETINDLPLNGRNYQNLLQLRPGVTIYPGGGQFTQSTNGIRPEDNVYMVDGLNNDEPFSGLSVINAAAAAGDASTILPIDAIQEFNVEENPKAEFGGKPGAIVNVGLKSGTNGLHGTAYAFGRDGAWDAHNYFIPGDIPVALEQFGATVGGPLIKDKFFFFGGYEGQRYTVGSSFTYQTPTITSLGADAANSIPDAVAGLQAAGITPSALSLNLAGCTLGPPVTCTGNLFPANKGTFDAQAPTNFPSSLISNNRSDNGLMKVDYHLNQHHTLNGLYFFGQNGGTWNDAPNELSPAWESLLHTRAQVGSGNWVWTPNFRWVNELRIGYSHLYQTTFSADHDVNPTTYGINTGVTNPLLFGFPIVKISGFSNFELGQSWPQVQGPDNSIQFIDHVSYLHGSHAFKFGGEIIYGSFAGGNYEPGKGTITFRNGNAFSGATPLEDFFAGAPTTGSLLVGDPTRHVHNNAFAVFLQDDWRLSPRFTLNLGLRYELNTVLKESHNLFGNFDPTQGLVQVGKQVSSPYNGDHNNFSPRFGLAWDVQGNGKTIVRAGGGVTYDTLSYNVFLALGSALGMGSVPTGATLVQNGTSTPGAGNIAISDTTFQGSSLNWNGSAVNGSTIFPSGNAVQCGDGLGSDPAPCTTFGVNRNLRTPYVTTWTLDIQRAITNNLALDVAYIGDHGTKLVGYLDINQINPNSPAEISCGHCEAQVDRPYGVKFPYLQYINYLTNRDQSNYNGLQATLTQRTSHGLSFTAGYTYSHSLDDASSNWRGVVIPLDSTRPGLQYGNGDNDIRHRFTLSVTYAIPGKKSWGQLLEGWRINSIAVLESGLPWGALDASDDLSGTGEVNNPNFTGERWDFFGNPSDFKSDQNPTPYFPGSGNPGSPNPTSNSACNAQALALDGGNLNGPADASLATLGCFAKGKSIMIPPAFGQFGTMGRNIFRDGGFRNLDFSVSKNWKFRDRLTAQFRAEFFNILNHPNFANPYGGRNGYGLNDPSAPGPGGFGCGCATPDQAAGNPVLGSGSNRAIQLGLKLIF